MTISIGPEQRVKSFTVLNFLMVCTFILGPAAAGKAGYDPAVFRTNEILGRPGDRSVTLRVVPLATVSVYVEYGPVSSGFSAQTATQLASANTPMTFVLSPLAPDTRYVYRLRYKSSGAAEYLAGDRHTFRTQRPRGSSFTFTIEADPHPYDKKGSSLWFTALNNQLADSADFMLDLGDTFGDDHNPTTITSDELRWLHLNCLDAFGTVCHSLPLLLCIGNHEGENGYYLLQTPPNNLAVNGTLWRKYYFPNPVPDGFYTGNTAVEGWGIGAPENYFAWEWGDALFVVLDVYRYYTANEKPGGWDWTIGAEQYAWLKQTLETSTARYKFVFAHHLRGQGRGAVVMAPLYEWGGYETDGVTWGFTKNRPGWAEPIHQLMVRTGVTVFFQGHDHLFAKEELDGIVYQEVPMPSDSTYIIGIRDNGSAYTGVNVEGSGHIRVTVGPSSATVSFIRAWLPADETAEHANGETAYTYTVLPRISDVAPSPSFPSAVELEQNYPNPFNPSTVLRYRLNADCHVLLRVYTLLGQPVATLVDGRQNAGGHQTTFTAAGLPAGVYVVRLDAGGIVRTKKALLIR